MKIAFVLNHFLPYNIAGTEIYTWALSKHLITKNIAVIIIIPNFKSNETIHYLYEGIEVISFPTSKIQDKLTIMGLKKPEGLNEFKNILEKENPDIIHFQEYSRGSGIGIEHIKIAKSLNKIIVNTFHISEYTCQTNELIYKGKYICDGVININKCSNCYLHKRKQSHFSFILIPLSNLLNLFGIDSRKWANKIGTALGTTNIIRNLKSDFLKTISITDQTVVLTEWYYNILVKNKVPKNKLKIIKQGLPTHKVSNNNELVINKKLKIIFIGRICYEKGLHLLIDALLKLNKNDIELDIYGQSMKTDYENSLKTKTLNYHNINWKGVINNQDVYSKMIKYDALCLCSMSEMSPLVIQEAFAAKVPVIASNVYGNAEQIKDGINGLLFKFNNADSLKEQLEKCIKDKGLLSQLKHSINIPRSFERVADEHLKLYSELIQ